MEEDHVYEHEHEHEHEHGNNDSSVVNLYYRASSVHDTHVHPLSSSDEMSMLLHQILCHSSSSSPATVTATTSSSNIIHVVPQQLEINNAHRLSKSSGISPVDFVNASVGGGGPLSSGNVMAKGANVSCASVGHSENETTDEHDCQSEEGFPASIDEVTAKPARPRSSSKRSRAAEVHNLSEKRRRSRINEKMKALQNLIPNSHKTDKASMLDEAIEYLKHLQVQVQMLTMRNGIPLRSMCLPGVLPPNNLRQMKLGFDAEIGSLCTNTTGRLVSQETEMQNMFNLPNQCNSSNQLQLPNMSNIINPGTVFTIDAPIQANLGTIQCGTASGETSREDMMPHQLNVGRSVTNPSVQAMSTFHTRGFDKKDSSSLEACMIGRDRVEGGHQATDRNLLLSPSPHITG